MGRHDISRPTQATLDLIREEFRHDPITGELFRRVGTLNVDRHGHARLVANVGSKTRLISHIIWFLEYGQWPNRMLDHTNRDSLDNRPHNLREATHSQNLANSKRRRILPTGVYAKGAKYQARITNNRTLRTIGTFETPDEAAKAFIAEHLRKFGSHSRYFAGAKDQRFTSRNRVP